MQDIKCIVNSCEGVWKGKGPRRMLEVQVRMVIVERRWIRVKGLGGCWKFKWGWLIIEMGWGRVKGLGGCWKFKW